MDKFAERVCGSQIGGITVDHETPLRKDLTQKTKVSKEKTKKLRIKILSNDASPRYFITTIHQHRIFFVAPSPHFHKVPSKLPNPTAKVIQLALWTKNKSKIEWTNIWPAKSLESGCNSYRNPRPNFILLHCWTEKTNQRTRMQSREALLWNNFSLSYMIFPCDCTSVLERTGS